MAILTKPEPQAFAAGIDRLLENAALRKILGQSGRKLIDRVYNYSEFKEKLKDCYDQLLTPAVQQKQD
jgi:glycosyltransferase involved in cell wall biosynthesis